MESGSNLTAVSMRWSGGYRLGAGSYWSRRMRIWPANTRSSLEFLQRCHARGALIATAVRVPCCCRIGFAPGSRGHLSLGLL